MVLRWEQRDFFFKKRRAVPIAKPFTKGLGRLLNGETRAHDLFQNPDILPVVGQNIYFWPAKMKTGIGISSFGTMPLCLSSRSLHHFITSHFINNASANRRR